MASHRNRNNRKSGGDRKLVIHVPEMTQQQRLDRAIDNKLEKQPDWSLKQIGDWAYQYTGATIDMVEKSLERYCE